jgi:hypothetical protein
MDNRYHLAYNARTGHYWDGRAFNGSLYQAAELTAAQLAALRATYDNTESRPSGRLVARRATR